MFLVWLLKLRPVLKCTLIIKENLIVGSMGTHSMKRRVFVVGHEYDGDWACRFGLTYPDPIIAPLCLLDLKNYHQNPQ